MESLIGYNPNTDYTTDDPWTIKDSGKNRTKEIQAKLLKLFPKQYKKYEKLHS